jgi:hypothetical protein
MPLQIKNPCRHPGRRRFPIAWLTALLAGSATLAAVGCSTPPGRCGIPDLCDPVVMADPFPKDQCVPPKGVNPGHSGFTPTQWRVIEQRPSICCSPMMVPLPPEGIRNIEELPLAPPQLINSGAVQLEFSDVTTPPRRFIVQERK